ncbi:MAG: autoinducer binding domain-containing protein [Pseudomonadota bacterium]
MPPPLAPLLDGLDTAKTLRDLSAEIDALRDKLGVEHLIYHSVSNSGEEYAALTYGGAWVERYISENYARIDPVVLACQQRFDPVDWRTLDWSGRAVRAFLGEARDAGVGQQGLSVPIRGPHGQFALFTINDRAGDSAWERYTTEHMPTLILAAHFFHQKALEIEHGADFLPDSPLSPREADTLRLLALGHSRARAADMLSISEHTLRVYIENAREKLHAANTTHAVARALVSGKIAL